MHFFAQKTFDLPGEVLYTTRIKKACRPLFFIIIICNYVFVLVLLAIVFSVLFRITASDYLLFTCMTLISWNVKKMGLYYT